ncbi:MAG: ComEC/Rec2 family competence protein [Gammaproteobacteria bacterium]|nr:ComEC/Rec2 family competence protein [Gammaproteobacteria bacterium]
MARDSVANQRLRAASFPAMDAWRGRVAARIENLPVPDAGRALLRAFTVGDDRGITVAMWERMRVAGVVHLAVISGLHIALAAGFGMFLGTLGGRLAVALGAPWPARHVGALAAWAAGGLYTLMAGFGLATLRAFIMFTVFLAVLLLRRHRMLFAGFIWALAAIAVLEPLAPLAAGFWLSFGAVAVLLAWFGPRPRRGRARDLVGAQLVVSLGTAAGLLGFFGKLPLLAPLINLLAIPWVEILTVPFCLAGVVAFPLAPVVADWCWWIAGWSLQWFDAALAAIAGVAGHANWIPAGGAGWRQGVAAGAGWAVDARAAGAGAALSERHPVDGVGTGRARTATGIAGNRARCGAGACGGRRRRAANAINTGSGTVSISASCTRKERCPVNRCCTTTRVPASS